MIPWHLHNLNKQVYAVENRTRFEAPCAPSVPIYMTYFGYTKTWIPSHSRVSALNLQWRYDFLILFISSTTGASQFWCGLWVLSQLLFRGGLLCESRPAGGFRSQPKQDSVTAAWLDFVSLPGRFVNTLQNVVVCEGSNFARISNHLT